MNRGFDIFRMSANGSDPDRGTARMGQMRARTSHPVDTAFDHGTSPYPHHQAHDAQEERRRWSGRPRFDLGAFRHDGITDRAGRDLPGYPQYEMDAREMRDHRAREQDRYERARNEMHGPESDREVLRERSMVSMPPPQSPQSPQSMRGGRHEVWRGRDEEHDFWGFDRHLSEDHPSLWDRVKGAFTGKGPKNYVRADDRICEDVCEQLYYHPHIDASDIEVVVKDGEVTLSGTVDGRFVKRAAEDCVEHVRGVKDIHNHLRVRRETTK